VEESMKKSMLFGLAVAIVGSALAAEDLEQRAEASRKAADILRGKLVAELTEAMKAGGPASAIEVCQLKAADIATATSGEVGWEVGRTSLKVRNPANAPDEWETAVLHDFEQRKAAGEDPAKLEFYEVVEHDGKSQFRYMKAIPTGAPCLACHGKEMDPAVAAKVQKLYPEDQATGFSAGDIRGAFTITQPM
jgi:Protein of unknown function (DUF3365)